MTEAVGAPEDMVKFSPEIRVGPLGVSASASMGEDTEGNYVHVADLPAILQHALAVERERWEKETRERFHSKEIMTGLWGGEYGQEDHDVVNETLDAIFDKGEGDDLDSLEGEGRR